MYQKSTEMANKNTSCTKLSKEKRITHSAQLCKNCDLRVREHNLDPVDATPMFYFGLQICVCVFL